MTPIKKAAIGGDGRLPKEGEKVELWIAWYLNNGLNEPISCIYSIDYQTYTIGQSGLEIDDIILQTPQGQRSNWLFTGEDADYYWDHFGKPHRLGQSMTVKLLVREIK